MLKRGEVLITLHKQHKHRRDAAALSGQDLGQPDD